MSSLTLYTDASFPRNAAMLTAFAQKASQEIDKLSEKDGRVRISFAERKGGITQVEMKSYPSSVTKNTQSNSKKTVVTSSVQMLETAFAQLARDVGLLPLRWNYTPQHLESVKCVLKAYIKAALGVTVDQIIYNHPPVRNAALDGSREETFTGGLIPTVNGELIRLPKEIYAQVVTGINMKALDGAFASSDKLAPLAIHLSAPHVLSEVPNDLLMNDMFVLRSLESRDASRSTVQALLNFDDALETVHREGWKRSHVHTFEKTRVCLHCNTLRDLKALWTLETKTAGRFVFVRLSDTSGLDWSFSDSNWLSGIEKAINLSQPIETTVFGFVDSDPSDSGSYRTLYLTYIAQCAFMSVLKMYRELDVILTGQDVAFSKGSKESHQQGIISLSSVSVSTSGEIYVLLTSFHQLQTFIGEMHRLVGLYDQHTISEIPYTQLEDAVLARYSVEKVRKLLKKSSVMVREIEDSLLDEESDVEDIGRLLAPSLIVPIKTTSGIVYSLLVDSDLAKNAENADKNTVAFLKSALNYYEFCRSEINHLVTAVGGLHMSTAKQTARAARDIVRSVLAFRPTVVHGIKTCSSSYGHLNFFGHEIEPESRSTPSKQQLGVFKGSSDGSEHRDGSELWDGRVFTLGWYGLFDYGGLEGVTSWAPLGFSMDQDIRAPLPVSDIISVPVTLRQIPAPPHTDSGLSDKNSLFGLPMSDYPAETTIAMRGDTLQRSFYTITLHYKTRVILSLQITETHPKDVAFVGRSTFDEFLASNATKYAKSVSRLLQKAWKSGLMLDTWSLAYYGETGRGPSGVGFVHLRTFLDRLGIHGCYLSPEETERLVGVLSETYARS